MRSLRASSGSWVSLRSGSTATTTSSRCKKRRRGSTRTTARPGRNWASPKCARATKITASTRSRKAWSKDHFLNVRVSSNTLEMYDKQIPTQYDLVDTGIFKIRYAKEERPILERYVPKMLGEAWASMKARYNFVPKVPVQVERAVCVGRRAIQRSHLGPTEYRHSGRVFRRNDRRHQPEGGALQLGQRRVARARARICNSALEEPCPALVHGGPLRIRDDRASSGMGARAGSGALSSDHSEQAAGRGRHEPRVHARDRRGRRDDRVLRREPDAHLDGRALRHERRRQSARALGPRQRRRRRSSSRRSA